MRFKPALAVAALALCGSAPARLAPTSADLSVAVQARGPKNAIVPGFVLVKFSPSTAAQAQRQRRLPLPLDTRMAAAAPQAAATLRYQSRIARSGWTLWRIPPSVDARALAERLTGQPGILAAQPVHRVYALLSPPNDPDYYALEDSQDLIIDFSEDPYRYKRLWHLEEINAFDAWSDWPNQWYTAANKPTDPPSIAIIDTGADMDHPDFINAGGAGTDITQGGQFDKSLSVQFSLGEIISDDTNDLNGHGTHVTGLALAAGNNGGYQGHGVIGSGYAAQGIILRVFDDQGIGTDTDAAAAIYYAADHGIDIINLSLGTESFSQLFQDAVTYAFQKGSLVVCAGNEDGTGGGDLGPIYPAACSGALAVTGSGPYGVSANDVYTGTGPYLDIAAPGGTLLQLANNEFGIAGYAIQFVYSTTCRTTCTLSLLSDAGIVFPPYTLEYSYLAGTSMACPIVSGAAAMYYGKFGLDQQDGWTNLRAYRALERSAQGFAPLGTWEFTFGYGILDMAALLQEADTRSAAVGAAEGIVYYNGTPLANVRVSARRVGTVGGRPFTTTTRLDGIYRFEALPPGIYDVTAVPFGAKKTKRAHVIVGCDQTGLDFWCGTYTGDETAPEVPRFEIVSSTASSVTIRHWGLDTETGLDSIKFRIGSASGGADVLADTEVIPDNNTVELTGLSLTPGQPYYLRGTYSNGAGMATIVDLQFNGTGPLLSGNVTLENWAGGQAPVVVELRTPGTTTVVESHNVVVHEDGSFSLRAIHTGTYDIAVKGSHWLRKKRTSVVIPAGGVSGLTFSLPNGDVDGDNKIGTMDYSQLSRAFGTHPGDLLWNANADVDGTLLVDMTDYTIVRTNYRKVGDP